MDGLFREIGLEPPIAVCMRDLARALACARMVSTYGPIDAAKSQYADGLTEAHSSNDSCRTTALHGPCMRMILRYRNALPFPMSSG